MNSFYPLSTQLAEKKQKLEKSTLAFNDQKQWMQKRECIETHILALQKEIHQNFYQLHQKNDQTVLFSSPHVQEQQRQLHQLKQAQGHLDQLLDQIEELTEEDLEQQHTQFLFDLWLLHPQLKETQERQWQERNEGRCLERELQEVEAFFSHLSKQLSTAIHTRHSIKGKGILKYIFGTSPNVIIEQQLFGAHALIQHTLPLFEKIIQKNQQMSTTLFIQKVEQWSENLKIACHSLWSFRHIETIFLEAYLLLQQFINELQLQQQELSKQLTRLDIEIQEWIDKAEK